MQPDRSHQILNPGQPPVLLIEGNRAVDQQINKLDRLLNTKNTAEHLDRSPGTIKNSRRTGRLAGVEAPAFIKVGRCAYYRLGTLEGWLEQFGEPRTCNDQAKSNTGQSI